MTVPGGTPPATGTAAADPGLPAPGNAPRYPRLAEIFRSGVVESVHHGTVAGVLPDGSVGLRAGPVTEPVLPRSTAKPFQALACLRAGAGLAGATLAIAAGSHIGEPRHTDAVRRILADAGVPESALRCPPSLPGHEPTRHRIVRAGGPAAPVHMNCSGKHAAMLAACVAAGWPVDSYADLDHPVQRLVCDAVSETAGEAVAQAAVDGCGAPVFAITPVGLARAARALVLAAPGSAPRAVADAMRAHPEYVGGSQQHVDTDLMRLVPGLVAKSGAEGTLLLATAAGHAVVVKVLDGGGRATSAIGLAALDVMGVDVSAAHALRDTAVMGPTRAAGTVRVTL
ncbi:asparaginase [Streptomyces mirabilis]|uniref:asparaginase n=1 Tax=Streptomyces mirabilis TaxID=68239 RepID=UPI0036AE6073